MSIDQQFVEFVIKSLVSKPDEVKVERRIDEKGVLLELTVDPEDLGRVIGKRGATAQSIRTLLRALGTKNDARYNLKIVDNGPVQTRSSSSSPEPSEPAPLESEGKKDEKKSEGLWGDEDDGSSSDKEAEKVVEETAENIVEDSNDSDKKDSLSKTRKELADLDDLDV